MHTTLHTLSLVLLIIGGINTGMVSLLGLDVVDTILGGLGLTTVMHVLIGLSGVVVLIDTLKTHHVLKI